MKKIILWSIVSLVIAGIAGDVFLWLRKPQVIKLNDGTKLTLVGVTYGKHHVAPKIKIAGARARGGGARMDSTNDTLVVWIEAEHKANQYPNYQLLVYDKANTACVSTYARAQSQIKNGVEIQGFMLDAYPRWDRKMVLRVMNYGQRGQQVSKEQFVVSNPARSSFAKWTPDPLSNSQSDGDLDVTLTKLIAAAPSPYNRGNGVPKNDPMNKCVQIAFDVRQKGQSVTNWHPVRAETSDAVGNHVTGWINQSGVRNGQSLGCFYQPELWPDEPAWRLRLEFSRTSGFNDDELWSVTNISVRAGSQQEIQNAWSWGNQVNPGRVPAAFAETTLNGIHVKLFPAIQYTDYGNNKVVGFVLKADPDPETDGMRMSPLSVTDNQGRALNNQGSSWGGGNYQYEFGAPRNIQSLNVTIALHRSRFFEYTVKPAKQ